MFIFALCFALILVLNKVSIAESNDPPGRAHAPAQVPAEPVGIDVYAPVQATVSAVPAHASMPPYAHVPAAPHSPVPAQALPFGYPPYPTTVEGLPPYGYPYSFPRVQRAPRSERPQRPFFARFAPPPAQPYPLPQPGTMPAPVPPPPPAPPLGSAPPLAMGMVPPQQGMIAAVPPAPALPGPPVVVHRPTPFKNFRTLMFAPRPYIGYDPYAGYPPYPGYVPPQ